MQPLRRPLLLFLHHHPGWTVTLLLGPAVLWLLILTLLPMGIMAYYSVLSRGPWGTIIYTLTLDNYRQVADPVFLRILWRSLRLALLTTALCLLSGYALAYWIAFYGGRRKQLYSFLVILPFWTSDLVRLYAWITLLADHGIINNFLMTLGVLQHPLPLLHNEGAVLLGLVYTYLPFMVLPLYASLERLDRAVLEAAADLGATPGRVFLEGDVAVDERRHAEWFGVGLRPVCRGVFDSRTPRRCQDDAARQIHRSQVHRAAPLAARGGLCAGTGRYHCAVISAVLASWREQKCLPSLSITKVR